MNETSIKNTTSPCVAVARPSYWSVLRWIHFDAMEDDFSTLANDRIPRLEAQTKLPPMEIVIRGVRVAAAYFVQLDGSVATLGGLRCKPGFESFASELIDNSYHRLVQLGIRQTQALVDVQDALQNKVLARTTFDCVTQVKQLCYEVHPAFRPSNYPMAGLSWIPVGQSSFSRVAELVQATFEGSLDCPALNGLRNAEETTQGFLDGRSWEETTKADGQPWWLLCHEGEMIGCSLVNHHTSDLCELAYMGLTKTWRAKRLGRMLVEKAIESAQLKNTKFLMSAVDGMNWPAVNLYKLLGFRTVKEMAVWLPKPMVKKLAA